MAASLPKPKYLNVHFPTKKKKCSLRSCDYGIMHPLLINLPSWINKTNRGSFWDEILFIPHEKYIFSDKRLINAGCERYIKSMNTNISTFSLNLVIKANCVKNINVSFSFNIIYICCPHVVKFEEKRDLQLLLITIIIKFIPFF